MKHRPLVSIIDDAAAICRAIRRLLQSMDVDALCYASAADFLANGLRHNPDCIILDIHMPVTNGIDLGKRIRGGRPDLPIIFITAHEDDETRLRILREVPLADYIHKPFSDDELINALRRILEREQEESGSQMAAAAIADRNKGPSASGNEAG